jgi:3-(3-hydroxy-phenyl)propionate hydroxylase
MTISTPLGNRKARAAYIVACDGGTSGVREGLGVKLVGSTYAERWLVVDAIVWNHNVRGITFGCDPRRPTVELPAVGDRVRWEFMQMPGEREEELKCDDTVRALVQSKAGIDAFEIERKAVYTFHARVADRWRIGRVFLAGDAAHLMPPFAGQGMNGGMKDAVNLSWKLAAVLGGQASEEILDTYEVERAPIVRRMVELSRRLGSVIMPTSRVAAAARDTLFACLNLSGRFRAFIGRGGVMPPPAIHRSAMTASGKDALIGQMAPQPTAKSSHGEVIPCRMLAISSSLPSRTNAADSRSSR